MLKENVLLKKTKEFALKIIELYKNYKTANDILLKQLLRSGTSVGANVYEANYASSKPDFVSKLQIALKECYESLYWLELLIESNTIPDCYSGLIVECKEIKKILVASCVTAKNV